MSPRRLALTLLALVPVAVAFQNCGKGFEPGSPKTASSQCKAKEKADAQKVKWAAADLRCDDFASYACERRVFSPDVETMTHSLKECLPGDTICVDVDVRQFRTAGARGPAAEFKPGGSYNHEEVNCSHRMLINGMAVYTGDRATLEEALSDAMSACEKATEL